MADEPPIAEPAPTAPLPQTEPPSRWRVIDKGPTRRPWRVISAVLLIVGCVLAPLAVTAAWAKNLVTDQDAYLEAAGPLITDPVIIDAAGNRIVTGIDTAITNLNLTDKVGEELQSLGLPPRLSSLATSYLATFRTDITDAVTTLTDQVLRSPQVATVWNEANAKAHAAFVTLMQGQPTRLGSINLDLSATVSAVKQKLSGFGVAWAAQIPDVPVVFNLSGNADVQRLSGYYDALVTLGRWLPIGAVLLLAASILLAPSRLGGLSKAAGGLAVSMLALAVLLIAGREWLISQVPAQPEVTRAFLRQLTVTLVDTIRLVAVVAAVLSVLAWMLGRSCSAVAVRTAIRRPTSGLQRRWHWAVRIGAGVVAVVLAVVLLFSQQPGLIWAMLITVVAGPAAVIAFAPPRGSAPSTAAVHEHPATTPG